MEDILQKYTIKYNEIKILPEYRFSLSQGLISELLALPPENRFSLLPLFKIIEEESFENNLIIPNLNYESILKEKELWDSSKSTPSPKTAKVKQPEKDNFNNVLFHLSSKYEQLFGKIKGYYFFRLENAENSDTKVVILYDDEFSKHPEINSFDDEPTYEVKKYPLNEFIELLSKEPNMKNQNYLCILLLTPHLRNNEPTNNNISTFLELFSIRNFISIKKIPLTSAHDYEIKHINDGIDSIKNYSNKVFNNRELSFEEEFIIKKLFPGSEMILDYKILKKGNSGSKVIEVLPLRIDHPSMVRFVIKFSPIDVERKIKKESELFSQYVADVNVPNYSSVFVETKTHEAIKYKYASSDSKKDSYPFAKLIDDKIQDKYKFSFTLEDVINDLFNCDPYKIWNTKVIDSTKQVKAFYIDYLKTEEKIFKTIALIKGIDMTKLESEILIVNYKKIIEYSLKTKEKICHGDLHSENFFKDDKEVYIIDFGWTGRLHSLIDYSTLECSLKFKHLPFYIPIEELIDYEKSLLSINSFSKNYDLSGINREKVRDIFSLIIQLRMKATEFMNDKNNIIEYLISLFILTFRQIQYADLNQSYAMRSAEILSEEIIKLI